MANHKAHALHAVLHDMLALEHASAALKGDRANLYALRLFYMREI